VRPLALALTVLAAPLGAQLPPSRSGEYLFAAGPTDVRALWVNPAGPSVVPQASILGEVTVGREIPDDWRVSQYTFGLSSRGVSLGYQRDRHQLLESIGTWRLGGSVKLGRGAFGTAIAFHRSRRGWDVGVRYQAGRQVQLAAVVRNIGRPTVRDSVLRVTLVSGLAWQLGALRLSSEAVAVERRPADGYDVSYRTGMQLALPLRWRATAVAAVDLNQDLQLRRWSAGLALGGTAQLVGVASGLANTAAGHRIESLSVSGVSARIVRQDGRAQSTSRSGITRQK
jgi:hypothetical protein